MRNIAMCGLVLMFTAAGLLAEDKPKYTTKEVMKEAMKEKLVDKVIDGKATDDEKKHLLELFEALAANKPAKGDADSWKKLTSALVDATKKDDKDALKKAKDCGACHKVHKYLYLS